MNLAISNLAWETHDDPAVLAQLRDSGVNGIEIAPTKIWPGWEGASQKEAASYQRRMAQEGFQIPALQAILFGKPELQILEPATHVAFLEHLRTVADLAAGFGAKVMVLGAPKNRRRGQLATRQALGIACDLLHKVGDICVERRVCIGLEHNPIEYGCDFVTNAAEARELVDRVGHPGVQLHLDAGGLHLCGGDIGEVVRASGRFVHYHVSEPMLAEIHQGVVDHLSAFRALREIRYEGWLSIEMMQPLQAGADLKASIRRVQHDMREACLI